MDIKTKTAFVTGVVVLTGSVWFLARRDGATPVIPQPIPAAIVVQPEKAIVAAAVQTPTTAPAALVVVAPAIPVDRVAQDGSVKHVAQPGDTVGGLAEDILGKNSPANRDAIVNANSSLKADPDKLLAGKAYRIPSPEQVAAARTAVTEDLATPVQQADTKVSSGITAVEKPAVEKVTDKTAAAQPDADQIVADAAPRTLRYTAREGDTVTTLATKLLGSDTQDARDAIINNNPSLKRNPDRLVAGQTYWIPAPAKENQ